MNELLKKTKCFLLDLDGTIYDDDDVIDGAIDAVNRMRERGKVVFLTNNSSLSVEDYLARLTRLGFAPTPDEVVTAGTATIEYVRARYGDSARVFALCTDSFRKEAIKSGLNLVDSDPDVAIVCYDTDATFKKFEKTCDFVFDGVPYVASHPDVACPKEGGMKPDVGSFVALIETATGVKPAAICGKPFSPMAEVITSRYGVSPAETAMFGDRMETDIRFGANNGFTSVLVLTGATTRDALSSYDFAPDVILDSVAEWDD